MVSPENWTGTSIDETKIPMSLKRLPTLAQARSKPQAMPKDQLKTRLDQKTAQRRADDKAEADCIRSVWYRDRGHCRICGIKAVKTLTLQNNRGEVHHLVGRRDRATRFLLSNLLLVCRRCHVKLTKHELALWQAERTTVDASEPFNVTVVKPKPSRPVCASLRPPGRAE
jgi:5-methylcytosine-specific restriction endonuclease McrA